MSERITSFVAHVNLFKKKNLYLCISCSIGTTKVRLPPRLGLLLFKLVAVAKL
jgi:hypothetical protein